LLWLFWRRGWDRFCELFVWAGLEL
jgi:hypothetical protein